MSKQQRDAIDAALRAEPFGLNQSTDGHRKTFDAFAVRPYPADVAAADVTLGGVGAIELTVAGYPADPTVLYFHGGGYVAALRRERCRFNPLPTAMAVADDGGHGHDPASRHVHRGRQAVRRRPA